MKDGEVIRVLRFIEYEYEDVDAMTSDMARWTMNGGLVQQKAGPGWRMRLRSSNLPPVVQPSGEWLEEPEADEEPPEDVRHECVCPRHGLVTVTFPAGEAEAGCPAPQCGVVFTMYPGGGVTYRHG